MKKATAGLLWLLLLLLALFPVGMLVCAYFGYVFKLTSVFAFSVTVAALSVCSVMFMLRSKTVGQTKMLGVLSALVAPLSLMSAACCLFEDSRIWVAASGLIAVGCCCFLTIRCGNPTALKVVSLVLSALMLLPIGFLSFIALTFGNIGRNTVVQSVNSTGGTYRAEVIDSDQGALGGDTLVYVYENRTIDAVLFTIEKKPQQVYVGEWGEFNDMQVYWKSDDRLVINSVEYEIECKIGDDFDNQKIVLRPETTVSYANRTGEPEIYVGALNSDKMAQSSVQHLPIYKHHPPHLAAGS